ncbi:tripeptidyl aminopeptidase [Saccharopolyspora subtropica]|uniref:Alpha/beta hydrolase n=1 Tax=Saccharopolyspora thermophila TaxID=89367 RepID=A0A917JWI9_9PSEU|nr:alpha/beta hydrolase [Saccharopolyspora subtropica]GGI89634.1 tripeptidyl aminopeptidase [Saccharopolyspora subtropica]
MIRTARLGLTALLIAPLINAVHAPLFVPCAGDPAADCAEITVPLDYSEPRGRQISLAVKRIRASGTPSEYRGALLVNPGGPGGSGFDYAVAKRAKLPEPVQRAYDVIGFDPRGVGRSAPVDCGPLGGLFDHPGADPVPPDDRTHLDRLRAVADDCRQRSGAVLTHINTVNTARDVERIRQALGQPRLNFLGVSYGSYLGAAYAAEFPHRVGRMVLDSVVSPGDWHDFDVRQGFAMLAQREVLFRWIAAHPEFGLGPTVEDVRAHYLRARSALAEHPARGTFGPAEFDHLVYRTLSRTERWEPFARAVGAYLHAGDTTGLTPELPGTDVGSRNYEAALRIVKCADSPRPSTAEVLGALRSLRAADPQPVLTGLESAACRYWPRPRETARLGHPAMPPVLLVQAEHDPTTPLPGARRMQQHLPGSRMVLLHDSYSHGVFASQRNACVDTTVAAYLVDGTVPAGDVDCRGPGLPG